jgi:putative FmdB family regulatory protein
MPTYPYACEGCQHAFDAFQKITDAPLSLCPQCGKEMLKRGIGGGMASFHFKGKGFYITDYKKDSSKEGSSSSSCCPCNKKEGDCKA